ncbi:MAG: hypothetical protein HQ557_07550 [Bacteroidetes bacterium]|nr:hypothetical protein [Bacteroidota bacterium]
MEIYKRKWKNKQGEEVLSANYYFKVKVDGKRKNISTGKAYNGPVN